MSTRLVYVPASREDEAAAKARALPMSPEDERVHYEAWAGRNNVPIVKMPRAEYERLSALAAFADRVAEAEARAQALRERALEARARREIAEADASYPIYNAAMRRDA